MDLDVLVKSFQKGDIKAFEKLYSMYADSMLGVIYYILKDREMAEDTLQEVFVKIWNNASSYQAEKGRFFTWILNVSRNAAIDKTRSKEYKNAHKSTELESFEDSNSLSVYMDHHTDTIGLLSHVKALGEKCRQIIDMIYLREFTQQETCEHLNLPLGTVKTRSRNCMNQLRKLLNISI